ncbi:hypothetical protein ACIP2X_09830 [Streptomyces sp. NPDC089424]|uniref:DUF6841 family protein n=1 Tax=Streptomyces sp. NPDC089424 TaxID=3365917 RepID=UPI0037F33BEA
MDSASPRDELARAAREARGWFFDAYFPAWVAAARDAATDPRSVLDYWRPPLHVSSDDLDPARARYHWCPDPESVLSYLAARQAPLKAVGYTHTEVPDCRVTAYSSRAVGIDAIWSRRAADEREIERVAVHFEVRRDDSGSWHMIAIAGHPTEAERLTDTWVVVSS